MTNLYRFYIVFCFYVGLIVTAFPFSIFNVMADILFLVMVFLCLTSKVRQHLFFPGIATISIFMLTLSCVWAYGNGNDISTIALSLRQYKNFILFLPLAYVLAKDFNFFMDVYKYSLWISVPVSVLQYLTVDKSLSAFADHVVGVFGYGQSGTLSILIVIYVIYELLKRERNRQKIVDWYLLILLPILLNETKIVFFMLPIGFCYSYIVLSKNKKNFIKILPIFIFGFIAAELTYRSVYNVSILAFFNAEFIEDYFYVDQIHSSQEIDIGRFKRVEYALDYLEDQSSTIYYFGLGLGSSFVGSDSGQIGIGAKEFFEIGLHTGSRIQLYYMVLDFGVLGTIFFLSVFLAVCIHVALIKTNSESKILAVPCSFIFLMSFFYQTPFSSHVLSLLFFFSYYSLIYDYKQRTDSLKASTPAKKIRILFR